MNKKLNTTKKMLGLVILASFFSLNNIHAQSYSILNRRNLNASFASYHQLGYKTGGSEKGSQVFNIGFNYGLLNCLEIGSRLGYTSITTRPKTITDGFISGEKANTFIYGANANFHLLPFFIPYEKIRFDIYISGQLGGISKLTKPNQLPAKVNELDYGLYFGSAFYIGRHLGLFGEIGKGNYKNSQIGLTVKF